MTVTTGVYFAKKPTPLLNDPDVRKFFGGTGGKNLALDSHGLLRNVETILFPGTKLTFVNDTVFPHILQVATREYPYEGAHYVDERFLVETDEYAPDRPIYLPEISDIVQEMRRYEHFPYVWGGNWPEGIPELLDWYPPANSLDDKSRALWKLQGVDCSGLLYKATKGYTPRNTSSLVIFGKALAIEGLTVRQILPLLRPLDLIVWPGHVICMMEDEKTIESVLAEKKVIICDAKTRLEHVISELNRNPKNTLEQEGFMIRRWHPKMRVE